MSHLVPWILKVKHQTAILVLVAIPCVTEERIHFPFYTVRALVNLLSTHIHIWLILRSASQKNCFLIVKVERL